MHCAALQWVSLSIRCSVNAVTAALCGVTSSICLFVTPITGKYDISYITEVHIVSQCCQRTDIAADNMKKFGEDWMCSSRDR